MQISASNFGSKKQQYFLSSFREYNKYTDKRGFIVAYEFVRRIFK